MHDITGRVSVASERAAALLGVGEPDALVGRPGLFGLGLVIGASGVVVGADDQPAAVALRTGQDVAETWLGAVQPDGRPVQWFTVEAKPLFRVGEERPYAAVSRLVPRRGLLQPSKRNT
jgi:PAS domain-containing protein